MPTSDPLTETDLPRERGGFVALAVIAAAVGAGAALLLAPAEGARTRERVGQGLRSFKGEAAETIAQLQREIRKRRRHSRRESQLIALAGVLVGAGLTALLTPESGAVARQRLGGALGRIKVGAVDRVGRLRERRNQTPGNSPLQGESVPSVQELGRDPNAVF
jgi:gas vesicle protein